jgi:cytidylate kinase
MAIITLSRQMGTGGRIIGQNIAKAAGYSYLDKEKIVADIQKNGEPWVSWEKEMGETCPTLWERFDRSFAGLVALVECAILEAAFKNNVVIVGRGAAFILRGVPHAFHMRVVGSIEVRAEWVVKHLDIPKDAVIDFLNKIDHERMCYLRSVYHRDGNDPREYDAVFDVGMQSPEEIVSSVLRIIPARDQAFSDQSQAIVRQRLLAARIKKALLIEPNLFIPTLDVYHNGTKLVIKGVIRNPKQFKLALQIIHEHAQGEAVDLSQLKLPD